VCREEIRGWLLLTGGKGPDGWNRNPTLGTERGGVFFDAISPISLKFSSTGLDMEGRTVLLRGHSRVFEGGVTLFEGTCHGKKRCCRKIIRVV